MMRHFRYFLIVALITFFGSKNAIATHIMGADFNYAYISEDSFQFTFVFYIDCVNGNAGAINSDVIANIGFFNSKTKDFIDRVEVTRNDPIRVSKVNYTCVTPPTNACVDRYEYVFNKRVHVGEDGVTVAFQRCCRNRTITNLVDPEGTGITIFATIPPTNVVATNSNPVFKSSPPNFLCNNAPLVFDHSATDTDGDSLVYQLYIPYKGATSSIPRPTNPSNPDYDEVVYTSQYSLSNLMGGKEKLKIDSKTGLLTVLPDKIGQFVVGIKVSEYRDGVKIGETLRDYQFNVLPCEISLVANFSIPELHCSDTLISPVNLSIDGNDYLWTVRDQATNLQTSNKEKPTFNLKKGWYTVKLVALNDNCKDSIEKDIEVGKGVEVNARFEAKLTDTCKVAVVDILNKSDVTKDWFWDIGDGSGYKHNLNLTEVLYDKPGAYTIKLRIVDSANCNAQDDYELTVLIRNRDTLFSDFVVEPLDVCDPYHIVVHKSDTLTSDWHWVIDASNDTLFNQEHVEFYTEDPGKHQISLLHTDTINPCVVFVPMLEDLDVPERNTQLEILNLYNVFTPNDDGLNDCFRIEYGNPECFDLEMYVYNRWGEQVYYTDDPANTCWNGQKENGAYYPHGTYFGIIRSKNKIDKNEETISITITFII